MKFSLPVVCASSRNAEHRHSPMSAEGSVLPELLAQDPRECPSVC